MIETPRTPEQKAMLRTWEAHLAAEFEAHDVAATMATMTAEPRVVHVGLMTGAADLLSGLPVERNRLITRARPGQGGPRPANPPPGTGSETA